MRLGKVIGRVTLSQVVPVLRGARWLIVSPLTRDHYQHGTEAPDGLSPEPTPVIYDNLGGGVGDTLGYVEGREAAVPFEKEPPIDAINVAIITTVNFTPATAVAEVRSTPAKT
jgi:carbon dioxide concentrating mechanism protein CcmL